MRRPCRSRPSVRPRRSSRSSASPQAAGHRDRGRRPPRGGRRARASCDERVGSQPASALNTAAPATPEAPHSGGQAADPHDTGVGSARPGTALEHDRRSIGRLDPTPALDVAVAALDEVIGAVFGHHGCVTVPRRVVEGVDVVVPDDYVALLDTVPLTPGRGRGVGHHGSPWRAYVGEVRPTWSQSTSQRSERGPSASARHSSPIHLEHLTTPLQVEPVRPDSAVGGDVCCWCDRLTPLFGAG